MRSADALLARLSRRTTSGRFIPEIDGLRFVSIALVVLFHVSGFVRAKATLTAPAGSMDAWLATAVATGHYGVQLFFIISGFVLALPFAAHHLHGQAKPPLRAYLLRRLTRLEPPYIIAMVSVFVLAVGVYGASPRQLWPSLGASLLYVHNLVYGRGSILNIVAWSLEIEVQFYLLAPLLAEIFRVRRRGVRRAAIVAAVTAAVIGQHAIGRGESRLSLTLAGQIQFFLLGFLLADLYLSEWAQEKGASWRWDVVGLAAWPALLASWMMIPDAEWIFLLLGFAVFGATFRGDIVRRPLVNRWLTTIGGMCYSIYLLHYPFVSALGRYTIRASNGHAYVGAFLLQVMMIVPPLMVVCTAYFVLIERPCMNRDWPQRLISWLARGTGRHATTDLGTQLVTADEAAATEGSAP